MRASNDIRRARQQPRRRKLLARLRPFGVSFAVLASLALGCGATVEVPRICFTESGLVVPGSPAGGDVTTPPFPVDLTNQIPLLRPGNTDTDLRVDSVTITPVAGAPDLSGIQTAKVAVQPASGPAVDLVQYQRNPAAPPPTALVLEGSGGDITPYLVSGRANLVLTLSGTPPSTTWTADVETCLHGEASVSP